MRQSSDSALPEQRSETPLSRIPVRLGRLSENPFNRMRSTEGEKMKCVICGKPADRCHIKTRATGGSDAFFNVVYLCRAEHILQHKLGWHQFCLLHPILMRELKNKGWSFVDRFGVMKIEHDELHPLHRADTPPENAKACTSLVNETA